MTDTDKDRWWIVEYPARVMATEIVRAVSRKDAEHKAKNPLDYYRDFQHIDNQTVWHGAKRVVREDKS